MLAGFFALLVWWGATQALLWLVRAAEPDELNVGALVIGGAAAVVAVISAADPTATGALLGFGAGLALWAAFEITFLTGAVLGLPAHKSAMQAAGRKRAWSAFRSILWHELALAFALLVLFLALHRTQNPMALYVFGLLWGMRISAKLNLFLGVRNHCAEFLPRAVRHLAVHFRDAPMNPLFPASVLAGTLASALLLRAALDPSADSAASTAYGLLAVLCALGTLEHWMMMTPLSPLRLWSTKMPRDILARQLGAIGQTL